MLQPAILLMKPLCTKVQNPSKRTKYRHYEADILYFDAKQRNKNRKLTALKNFQIGDLVLVKANPVSNENEGLNTGYRILWRHVGTNNSRKSIKKFFYGDN
ncbi:hypothetical protein PR048_026605 [Dryococelus australis]|uniref:Uncharacterized protein n=1 Tax=Dryococelus australis TaxID=614101 RepID=A0ABQ9GLS4_9NEOP|nr:hypothetical protein PR048_026605 [Dryococelus australis]